MGKTIGVISIKGGVGKTTIASSLASDLVNHYGKKVLLVDANYSAPNTGLHMDIVEPKATIHEVLAGSARVSDAIHSSYGVDVIPGSYNFSKEVNFLKLRDKLARIKDNYDFIILDSSPSLNEEVLSSIIASDALFVVTTSDYPTLSCSIKAAKLAKSRGRPISGVIVNRVKNSKYELSLDEMEYALGIPIVAKIKEDSGSLKSLFTRIPMSILNRNSSFGREINKLSSSILGVKEEKNVFERLFSFNMKREEVNRQLLKEGFYKSIFGS